MTLAAVDLIFDDAYEAQCVLAKLRRTNPGLMITTEPRNNFKYRVHARHNNLDLDEPPQPLARIITDAIEKVFD